MFLGKQSKLEKFADEQFGLKELTTAPVILKDDNN
jgi:hypothetical protein